MENDKALNNLYISCINRRCNNYCNSGIEKDIIKGGPPRGFYFENPSADILIVSKNPGSPLPDESKNYIGKTNENLYEAYKNFVKEIHRKLENLEKDPSLKFQKNLFRYISYFFDIPNPVKINEIYQINIKGIYQKIAQTSLVKCSTVQEQGKLTQYVMEECYKTYLKKEIEIFNPKLLLALGVEVYDFLEKKKNDHYKDVIYIRHPSYFYQKNKEKEILKIIQHQIAEKLGIKKTNKKIVPFTLFLNQ